MRTVLFHRKYRRFHGGHLKVWHYFNHVLAAPGFDARVVFDIDSSWDSTNPWAESREHVAEHTDQVDADALFIAGRDWQRLDALGMLDRGLPVLNLIQHVRHAEEWSIQSRYLDRKAIRICVSEEVAKAVSKAGSAGPTVVIPNSVDVPFPAQGAEAVRPVDLLIAGLKQPVLAAKLGQRLAAPGRTIEVLTDHLPREVFLDAIRRSRVTLFLPNEEEGFYLPALEGMALGTLVVCPDCVGNRSFCIPGQTAFRPAFEIDDLARATEDALALGASEAAHMIASAKAMAQGHSPAAERTAFIDVLNNLDEIWAGG